MPNIACFNQAETPLGVDMNALVAAMQTYVDKCVVPVWGTPAKPSSPSGFVKGSWAMVFLETADAEGALAYHDLTPDGLPASRRSSSRRSWTTTASGERVDLPRARRDAGRSRHQPLDDRARSQGVVYAYESADPVEEHSLQGRRHPDDAISSIPSYFEDFRKASRRSSTT